MTITLTCRAVLLDLDGVLVDSSVVVHRHWTRWGMQHRLDPDQVMKVAHGRRPIDTVGLLLPDHPDPATEAQAIVDGESTDFDGLVILPGVQAFVGSLPANAWTVCTSGPRPIATARLRFAQLPIPPAIVTGDDVTRGKPHPEPYQRGAANLQIATADCVVVEDSPAGIRAGVAAGCRVIGLQTTHDDRALLEAGACCLIPDLSALSATTIDHQLHLSANPSA
jgi:mannitol-1-/sugar-/sorbitol-6-phosphatase